MFDFKQSNIMLPSNHDTTTHIHKIEAMKSEMQNKIQNLQLKNKHSI